VGADANLVAASNLENLMKLLLAAALVLTSFATIPANAADKPRQCNLFFDIACKEDHYCRSLGTLPGQPAYIQCRLFVLEQRQRCLRGSPTIIFGNDRYYGLRALNDSIGRLGCP
jgi:hypothetical protein